MSMTKKRHCLLSGVETHSECQEVNHLDLARWMSNCIFRTTSFNYI